MSELESGSASSGTPAEAPAASSSTSAPSSTNTPASSPSTSQPPSSLSDLRTLADKVISGEGTKTKAESGLETSPAVPPAPAYTPNFKFKYLDPEANKQMEKEMDDWAKGFIKDKETEEKFSKLYAKAFGLDAAVASREKHKTENQSLRTEISDTKKSLGILSSYVQQDDMQSFFQALKIPEDKVLKYALERVQYREMTPEQRSAYDGQRDSVAKSRFLEDQNRSMAEQMQTIQVQTRAQELEQVMSYPQVSQMAKSFDERMGPGAFQQEVIRRGQLYWHQFQKDIPAHQAVNEVLQLIGGMQPATTPPTESTPVATPPSSTPGIQLGSHQTPEPKKIPVIPNISGSGSSPAKKLPKSISDLKKLSQAMGS